MHNNYSTSTIKRKEEQTKMNVNENLEQIIYSLEKINSSINIIAEAIYYCKDNCPEERHQALRLLSDNLSMNIDKLNKLWKEIN